MLEEWAPDTNLSGHEVPAPGIWQAVGYLRSLPPERIAAMQAALERERPKLLYGWVDQTGRPTVVESGGGSSEASSGGARNGSRSGDRSGGSGRSGASRRLSPLAELIVDRLCARAAVVRRLRPRHLASLKPSLPPAPPP